MDFLHNLEPIEKYVLIDLIIEKIKNLIQDGELRPGDSLPSERILSERLGVSRTSLRQALKALDVMGVIKIVPGKKTYIEESFSDILLNPFRFLNAVYPIKRKELFDIRRVIEEGIIQIIAREINEDQIEKIRLCLEDSESKINNVDQFNDSELSFQNSLIEVLENKILKAIMSSLNKFLFVFSKYERDNLSIENRKKSVEQHSKILEALKSRDPERARLATRIHLDSMEEVAKIYENIK
jgi:GntR family transcriptional regulator, transcriptional repressor for pyruvate dehydrogenase complex